MSESPLPVDFSFVLASSVHDMKNSVGMLMHTLEELNERLPEGDGPLTESMATLGYEASRINGELVQLLSLYRMQNQRLLVEVDECPVRDVIDEQMARNDMLFRSRGIEVTVECDDDLCWYLDAELIGGVINNLLVNAVRYCHRQIAVAARVVDDGLELIVADDGDGYPPFMLQAPVTESAGVSFAEGNTNLGLLFAREVARLHRSRERTGTIELANGGLLPGGEIRICLP